MTNKKKVSANYIYSAIYQIFLIIVPLITAPYLTRTILQEAVGINSYVTSIVSLFTSIGLLGVYRYSVREIAYVKGNKEKLSKTFWEMLLIRIILFIITSFIYAVYAINSPYKIYFLIQYLTIISTFFEMAWFYAGLEDFKIIVTRNFVVKILNVVSIFLFIKGPEDLSKLMIIYAIYALLSNILLLGGITKKVEKIPFKKLEIKKHILPILKLFLPQIATLIYLQVDKVMIENLTNNIESVGFYDHAEKIIKIPLALITALSGVMLPRISSEYKNENHTQVKRFTDVSFKFSLLMAIPLMFGLMAIADKMIPWYLGNGWEPVIKIMIVLAPVVLFISMSSITGDQYLTAVDNTKALTISYVISAITNLILNYFLIPIYGAVGAAIGTIVAEAVVFFIQIRYMKNITTLKEIIGYSIKYLIAGILMFVACYYVGTILSSNIITTFIQIVIGVFVYFITLTIFKDKFFFEYLNKALNLLTKKIKKK